MKNIHKYIVGFLINNKEDYHFLKRIIKSPLLLVSYAVTMFTKIKRMLYNRSFILKSKEPSVFTISIGNINLGGAGKTPLSYTIAEYLYKLNLKPCVISRGYKGLLKKKSILRIGNMSLTAQGKGFPMK